MVTQKAGNKHDAVRWLPRAGIEKQMLIISVTGKLLHSTVTTLVANQVLLKWDFDFFFKMCP